MSKPRGPGAAATDVSTPATAEAPDLTGREAALPRGGREAAHARSRRLREPPWVAEAAVLVGFLAAGVLVTWPRATFLAGRLPANSDQAQYVWNMWWIAHVLTHPGNPWFTSYLAAPVGIPLGLDTLMPLLGVVMAPVTLLFGPSASYNLLVIVMPGLAGYAMYRLARLWLPDRTGPLARVGALAAGAFYGLSGMVTFQAWAHLHTAAGCVFLPLVVEAAVRLRRDPDRPARGDPGRGCGHCDAGGPAVRRARGDPRCPGAPALAGARARGRSAARGGSEHRDRGSDLRAAAHRDSPGGRRRKHGSEVDRLHANLRRSCPACSRRSRAWFLRRDRARGHLPRPYGSTRG